MTTEELNAIRAAEASLRDALQNDRDKVSGCLMAIMANVPSLCNEVERLRKTLTEALAVVMAGAQYSNALEEYQMRGAAGQMVEGTAKLNSLFEDWHNKAHAFMDSIECKRPSPIQPNEPYEPHP